MSLNLNFIFRWTSWPPKILELSWTTALPYHVKWTLMHFETDIWHSWHLGSHSFSSILRSSSQQQKWNVGASAYLRYFTFEEWHSKSKIIKKLCWDSFLHPLFLKVHFFGCCIYLRIRTVHCVILTAFVGEVKPSRKMEAFSSKNLPSHDGAIYSIWRLEAPLTDNRGSIGHASAQPF